MLDLVRVFLVRHAHAEPGKPDELRALSARGKSEAQTLAERLAGQVTPPSVVYTSPLVRARETAAAIAERLEVELRVDDRLAPGATAADVRATVHGAGADDTVAVVGHQPDCSEIAREVTGDDPGFPTGSAFELVLDA